MRESLVKFEHLLKNRLPEKVEVLLEKSIHDSFEQEKYKDTHASPWAKRKKPVVPDKKILIGKGTMRRSIEVSRSANEIKASTDVVYAQRHNEGLVKMPQRQFMPKPGEANHELDRDVEKWLDSEMDKIFK